MADPWGGYGDEMYKRYLENSNRSDAQEMSREELRGRNALAAQGAAIEGGNMQSIDLSQGLASAAAMKRLEQEQAFKKPEQEAAIDAHRAQQRHYEGLANEEAFKLGIAKELRPESLAAARSTYGLNTASNQGEAVTKLDDAYGKSNARALAMPQWADPYKKVTPTHEPGYLSKLWSGDLYNPFNPKLPEQELRKKKINQMNESFLANNPLYR
jgi:hypothetical protein